MQFWDKDSFVDAPIRSLLHMFESEFPLHVVELVRFLSALCTGTWSAECVYVLSLIVVVFLIEQTANVLLFHSCLFIFFLVEFAGFNFGTF